MSQKNSGPSDWMASGPGAQRRLLCETRELMMVEFAFEQGGVGEPHNHIHAQSTYVESGKFEFTIAGETRTVKQGDSIIIPSNAVHSCVCLETGNLIDSFSPRRDDFMDAHGWTKT